ncbi:hypothetical protein ACP70R_044796 [Stipagrostis hirtigluma subsp. patula]
MASSDSDDYPYYSDDDENSYADDDENSYADDDENSCADDDENCDGHLEDDDDDDKTVRPEEPRPYVVVAEDNVRKLHDGAVAGICERLLVPPGFAAVLLRHYRWDGDKLTDEWFDDERRVRDAVGLPADGAIPTELNERPCTCFICFDRHEPGEMRSAGCSHFYCHECWLGYIRAAVGDGPRCLYLRCPDTDCSAAVVRELVDEVAAGDEALRARYTTFAVRSYVEHGKNLHIRWCPGPRCTRAVSFNDWPELKEVACECGHAFCFGCGEEEHRPASCETTLEWVAKNRSDAETATWVLAHTKHCPACRRPIEKNEGCMHMTCSPPCRHEFCWLCLEPWGKHGNFTCNRYEHVKAGDAEFAAEEARRQQAMESHERYMHYFERWSAHGASRDKARRDLAGLQVCAAELEKMAAAVGVPSVELAFVRQAYEQIVECRRMLRWSYAHMYYQGLESDDGRRRFCEFLQGEAEQSLERLHHLAEQERKNLCWDAGVDDDDAAKKKKLEDYRPKLAGLTMLTRNYFRKLVKGFESGMDEVVAQHIGDLSP